MSLAASFIQRLEAKVAQQLTSQRVGYLIGAGASYLNSHGYPLAASLWDCIKSNVQIPERDEIQAKLDAGAIGRLAFEFNFWNPQYREFPLLLVCEEAHAYVTREQNSQFAGARKSMERIAKEGRKYGVGLAVVSQRPHELSETVLAQCGTFLCLRITNPDDQASVRSPVPDAERGLIDILAGLGRGECMALGEAVPPPTRFKFIRPSPAPNSADIDFYNKWKTGPDDINVEEIVNRWRRQQR